MNSGKIGETIAAAVLGLVVSILVVWTLAGWFAELFLG